MKIVDWLARLLAAGILLQTLYFKFLGAEESVFIFSQLGAEPWGRYASGVFELAAAVLLLVPRTVWMGCVLALGAMSGAILSHLFVLGIEVQGDGGLLFSLAVAVFVASLVSLWLHRSELPLVGTR